MENKSDTQLEAQLDEKNYDDAEFLFKNRRHNFIAREFLYQAESERKYVVEKSSTYSIKGFFSFEGDGVS